MLRKCATFCGHSVHTCKLNFIYKRTQRSAKAKYEAKAESPWIMTFEFYLRTAALPEILKDPPYTCWTRL